jgi:hypothetical protein
MPTIRLYRGTGQDDLVFLSLPDRPYQWFPDLEIPWKAINPKGHPIYLTESPKFLGCEFHTVISCVPSLVVVKHTLQRSLFTLAHMPIETRYKRIREFGNEVWCPQFPTQREDRQLLLHPSLATLLVEIFQTSHSHNEPV